jgi:hypothetical protein
MTQYQALGFNLTKVCLMLCLIWLLQVVAAAEALIKETLHPVAGAQVAY